MSCKKKDPYEGFYDISSYQLSDDNYDALKSTVLETAEKSARRTVFLMINLKNYRNGSISDQGLSMLDMILSTWGDANKGIILRFIYDWDGEGQSSEPGDINTILTHMSQVCKVVNSHKDHVYILQGLFLGSWGEMHHSNYMAIENTRALFAHLASVSDPSIFLSVRTPSQLRDIAERLEPLPKGDAFSGTPAARLGLFNDGMFGGELDYGTYGAEGRAFELDFQDKLCHYVPNGGELIPENLLNNFEQALADLSLMHVSYVNALYDPTSPGKWKNITYNGDGVFHGMNGNDYIKNHLGYRYVLRSSALDYGFKLFEEETASLSFTLENVGFANAIRPMQMVISLDHGKHPRLLTALPVPGDLRFLDNATSATYTISFKPEELGEGEHKIWLNITDIATGEQIKLANTLPLTDKGYELGDVSVENLPKIISAWFPWFPWLAK
ncbi:hypothetical protein FACS1894111_06790 [Clostridia bacterium]|nr:hypothetical protein FACS1894111_06790 [Clostridia bacterium]